MALELGAAPTAWETLISTTWSSASCQPAQSTGPAGPSWGHVAFHLQHVASHSSSRSCPILPARGFSEYFSFPRLQHTPFFLFSPRMSTSDCESVTVRSYLVGTCRPHDSDFKVSSQPTSGPDHDNKPTSRLPPTFLLMSSLVEAAKKKCHPPCRVPILEI